MLRSLAICVSAEMFISLSCAMSMVGAPSGRSEATNFLLIGGVFSLRNVYGRPNPVQEFILSKRRNSREREYLLCVKSFGACSERLLQLVTGNLIGLREYDCAR